MKVLLFLTCIGKSLGNSEFVPNAVSACRNALKNIDTYKNAVFGKQANVFMINTGSRKKAAEKLVINYRLLRGRVKFSMCMSTIH